MSDLSLVTHTKMPEAAPLKRVAIIGTAETWKCCPWNDLSLEVWGLNDAYLIGVPRANRWFDLHPFHQMHFRQPGIHGSSGPIDPRTIPTGVYMRPAGHLDWLRKQPFPVVLQQARPDFPTSVTFPQQAILDWFKPYWPKRLQRDGTITDGPDYEVSTPSWMVMQAIVEGYSEIHVYGIHLATQWEYVQQRPNFEYLLGLAAGRGIKIVLPQATPICKAAYRYAFEPKADLPIQQIELEMVQIKQDGALAKHALAQTRFYQRWQRSALEQQIRLADARLADAKQQLARIQVAQMGR